MNENEAIFMTDPPPEGYTESGYLIVSVFTARGAIPIGNAIVSISYDIQGAASPYAVLTTDKSGRTPKIALPAPPRGLSLSPSNGGSEKPTVPFSRYNIEVNREGYYPAVNIGLQIFSGITAIQNVNIIPISEPLPTEYYKDNAVYTDEIGVQNL